ncbi:MAG TPA: YdeI/OmpD-associated family protein [Gemmatimonadales bacterium]|nr:YdeI/OmpD-associated family protein [Gemmatimonadales bacterium]
MKPRPLPLPRDFARALAARKGARAAFDKMPPSHKREYIEAIEEAKKPETRARRIAQAVQMIVRYRKA